MHDLKPAKSANLLGILTVGEGVSALHCMICIPFCYPCARAVFRLVLDVCSVASAYYTVNHKKRDILFLTITSANLNRFLQFLYHFNSEEILHATVV